MVAVVGLVAAAVDRLLGRSPLSLHLRGRFRRWFGAIMARLTALQGKNLLERIAPCGLHRRWWLALRSPG